MDPKAMTDLYEEYAASRVLASLAEGRKLVPGHGPLNAPVVVVGEAPGAQEEAQGKPFVGPSGKLLRQMLEEARIPWGICYVTNVVPWRPPGNRTPYPFEVQASFDRVEKEIALVDPVVVIAAGAVAWRGVTRDEKGPFLAARLQWRDLAGRRLVSIPHPSFLLQLRDPDQRRKWRDSTAAALAQAMGQEATA